MRVGLSIGLSLETVAEGVNEWYSRRGVGLPRVAEGAVDSTRPETFREARGILETFRAYAPTPYVVTANKQDMEDAWEPEDLRIILRLRPEVKILPCVATDKETVKNVLLELLYSILEEIDKVEEAA